MLVLLSACSSVQPAFSVASGEAYPVKGRQGWMLNQRLEFGQYTTSRTARSWTKERTSREGLGPRIYRDSQFVDLLALEQVEKNQHFSFGLKDKIGNHADVYAVSSFRSEDLQIGPDPNSLVNILEDLFGTGNFSEDLLYLELYLQEEAVPWQLLLDRQAVQTEAGSYRGLFARDGSNYYTLRPVDRILGKKGPVKWPVGIAGYEILNPKNEPVAAISTIDAGQVFFYKADPQERFLLAGLSAALLLQEDLSE